MPPLTLLFYNGGSLSEEWLATAAGIAITFFVFIMGVPAFVLQTFIAGNLRDVYYERIGKRWRVGFVAAISVILIIFLAGNISFDVWFWERLLGRNGKESEVHVPWVVFLLLLLLVVFGLGYLWRNFISSESIEKRLSKCVSVDAQINYLLGNAKKLERDLEHLSIMASEVRGGTPKKYFLEQCEALIEYLIPGTTQPKSRSWKFCLASIRTCLRNTLRRTRAHPPTHLPYPLLRRILQEVVTPSVEGGWEKASSENRKQALDLLSHTYNKAFKNGEHSYLMVIISHCMQEIAVAALEHEDHAALMDAIEKMAEIKGRYQEIFIVANAAFWKNQIKPSITALRKLEAVLRQTTPVEEERHKRYALYYWLGLVANLYAKPGAMREFAERQLHKFEPFLKRETFDSAYDYFANRMAYFDTANSVRALRDAYLLPEAQKPSDLPKK